MKPIDFTQLTDEVSISKNFNLLNFSLEDFLTCNSLEFYEELRIPKLNKRRKGYRVVYKPNYKIEGFHKNILTQINYKSEGLIHECAHGFIQGKSTLTNATIHLSNKYLLQTDIVSFFPSISQDSVKKVFLTLGCNDYIAELFSNICTINGCLAEGLNTSPALANIYFYELDVKLKAIADKHFCVYTRYADDLSFSSNNYFEYKKLLDEINDILLLENLKINCNKTRFSKYGQAQYVTGLSISNSSRPRIPRKIKKRLRQELYFIQKYGFQEHFLERNENMEKGHKRLKGWLDYAMNVEPEYFSKLNSVFKRLQ